MRTVEPGLFLIAVSIWILALRGEMSPVPHHHIFSSMVQSFKKTQEKPICKAYIDSKRNYCERHNYTFKYYEDINFEPNTHYQEPLSLRLHQARAYLFSRMVKQLTYLDFDTVIVQPEKTLDSIFAAEQAKHDFPCTVFVQADPYVLNSGFWSVVNTPWVRNIFLPAWDRMQIYAWQHGIFTNQAPLCVTILHAALEARGIKTRPCFNLKSFKMEYMSQVLEWAENEKAGYPNEKWHQLPKLSTYLSNLVDKGKNHRNSHVLYSYNCANYFYEEFLNSSFLNRSFRVSETDGVCFMGFDGTQMNRHHFMPSSALKRLNIGEFKNDEHDIRFKPTKYGRAYSEDLFMIHHHLEKNYRGFCKRSPLSKGENKSTRTA